MRLVCYIFFCAQVFRVIKSVSFSYLILFEKENYYDEILAFYDEKLKSIKPDGILMLMKSLICNSNYERFGFEILHFVESACDLITHECFLFGRFFEMDCNV